MAKLKGEIYIAAVSIGWNPVYNNKEKSIEAYLVEDFGGETFYGEILTLTLISFIRAESLFPDLGSLITAI